MNWADYVIVGVLVLSVLIGLWRGLTTEVLALAIWIAAFWVAWLLGPRVAALFDGHVGLPSARIILGYGLCFLAVLIAGALVRYVVAKLVESTGLSGTDRMLGMLFGLARGAFLVTLAVLLLGFTPFTRDPWWQHSQLLPTFEGASGWLAQKLPPAVRRYLYHPAPLVPAMRTVLPLRVSDPTYGAPGNASSAPASGPSVRAPDRQL